MIVTVVRQVTKTCPYKAEVDVGELTIVWTTDDDVPELHELADMIDSIGETSRSHEQWHIEVQSLVPDARVSAAWHTGPWEVRVDALPEHAIKSAGP